MSADRKKSSLRRVFTRGLVGTVVRVLVPIVQRWPVGLRGLISGPVHWLIWLQPKSRRLILTNLAIAFPEWPDEKRRQVGRESLRRFLDSILAFWWHSLRPERVKDAVAVTDEQMAVINEALDRGAGVIFLTPHMGGFEMGNLYCSAAVRPALGVMQEHHIPMVHELLIRYRSVTGATIIPHHGAARPLLRQLRSGEPVCLMVDQNTRIHKGGMFVDFFGLPATMSRAPVTLARKLGTPVMVFGCVAAGRNKWRAVTAAIIESTECESDEELAQLISDRTQWLVSQHPEEYLWMYERWRYIDPDWDGDRSRYPYYAKMYVPPTDDAADDGGD